ncbi:hypothetical protein [Bradyrhizobium sp. SZCCHNS3004]|uniref:hypothetical protein n=1 Tax=Bradyrhizobium sp. SZCCHNS3004 TaxID=3057312 RepID=UPI00291657F9|nr:hypothetical protein [Bradyrhizobium sp. SZCCHNS3004]
MIDSCYGVEELARIEAVCPQLDELDHVLRTLENAAREYTNQRSTSELMSKAALQREHWKNIARTAQELSSLLDETDCWLPPIWWSPDRSQDDHTALAAARRAVEDIVIHARGNADDFDAHSKTSGGRKNPVREKLYSQVLGVWTDLLGGELKVSKDPISAARGPLWRFFQAAVTPIMGDRAPKATSFADIVQRERERRGS